MTAYSGEGAECEGQVLSPITTSCQPGGVSIENRGRQRVRRERGQTTTGLQWCLFPPSLSGTEEGVWQSPGSVGQGKLLNTSPPLALLEGAGPPTAVSAWRRMCKVPLQAGWGWGWASGLSPFPYFPSGEGAAEVSNRQSPLPTPTASAQVSLNGKL